MEGATRLLSPGSGGDAFHKRLGILGVSVCGTPGRAQLPRGLSNLLPRPGHSRGPKSLVAYENIGPCLGPSVPDGLLWRPPVSVSLLSPMK